MKPAFVAVLATIALGCAAVPPSLPPDQDPSNARAPEAPIQHIALALCRRSGHRGWGLSVRCIWRHAVRSNRCQPGRQTRD